ncbi:MAG: PhzF family phenazine biosynthesis protein [Candidatus Hydrogenedentes bacterium]|nr:PhzF family phenazine biosynthesis protein [Candidatus Hydrogenedentota bacterium]
MRLPIYQIDAFTGQVFGGNPAAVCPLERWLPAEQMQAIAAENNLAETAYFVKEGEAFRLRWFTPTVEVDLCGHATLAAAYVLFECLGYSGDRVTFQSQSGPLTVVQRGALLEMDFPSRPPEQCAVHPELVPALGKDPVSVTASRDYLCVFESAEEVLALNPDFTRLKQIDRFAVIATAPGTDCDFVSRFFAPAQGVDEDPVTGSAHCTLVPYWSKRLGKRSLHARQVSRRGGELFCEDRDDRVAIAGNAVLYMRGEIEIA